MFAEFGGVAVDIPTNTSITWFWFASSQL